MTVELLHTLSSVSFIAAAIFFLAGVALFFLLDVPKLYGEVSGRTAKKEIEEIRRHNESTGNKTYKTTQSGRLQLQTAGLTAGIRTEKFPTSSLSPQANETTVLHEQANETTVLYEQTEFTVDVEMAFTESSEIIE